MVESCLYEGFNHGLLWIDDAGKTDGVLINPILVFI